MSQKNTIKVKITDAISAGADEKLLLIAGPCQIESAEHCLMIAERLLEITAGLPVNLVFKSSYDKANRTSINGKRGIGIDKGLKILSDIRTKTGLPVLTDVHDTEQVKIAAQAVDVLQTPAFLCRQTDLLEAVGKSGRPVNVKKGQFLAPEDMQFAAEKISNQGNSNIMLCERGSSFGYRDLIVDMRSLVIMAESGYPVIFDATHSVQSMGGAGGKSGGSRKYVVPLLKAAVAVGVSGVFIECHDSPEKAPSDGATMLNLDSMRAVLEQICRIRESIKAAK